MILKTSKVTSGWKMKRKLTKKDRGGKKYPRWGLYLLKRKKRKRRIKENKRGINEIKIN